jgi:hypothetical protein
VIGLLRLLLRRAGEQTFCPQIFQLWCTVAYYSALRAGSHATPMHFLSKVQKQKDRGQILLSIPRLFRCGLLLNKQNVLGILVLVSRPMIFRGAPNDYDALSSFFSAEIHRLLDARALK